MTINENVEFTTANMDKDATDDGEHVVLSLDDPRTRDASRSGNKAARLAELRQIGFDVPDGFALDAQWCTEVREVGDVHEVVSETLNQLNGEAFAVRSSGVAEDGHEEAMAGRYRTELNVTEERVPGAIVRCLQAARDADEREGREHEPVAILVQEMVDADVAGVAFSKDPLTGDDVRVVSAVRGLGDRLVSGLESGEDWRFEDGEVNGSGEVLDEAKVRMIVTELDRIADHFEDAQDVEWAWDSNRLSILQTRPITALPVPPPDEPIPDGTWIKDETHYPNGLSPLAGSVYAPALEIGMEYGFGKWGLMIEKAEQIVYKHEAYGRPIPVGGEKPGPPPPALVLGIVSRLLPPMRKLTKTAKNALESNHGARILERWKESDRPRLEKKLSALRDAPTESMSDDELITHFQKCVEVLVEAEKIHFELFVPYATALYDLHNFVSSHLDWNVHQTLELVSGLSEETSGPTRALRRLAERARESEVASLLKDAEIPDEKLADRLREEEPGFADDWQKCIERWGHRTMGYDLGEPTLAERPGIIRHRVIEWLEHSDSRMSALQARREDAEKRAREQLSGGEIEEFENLLAEARSHWPSREENVAFTDAMPNAAIRYAGLAIGRRLVGRGQLDRPGDMAMLTREELFDALNSGLDMRPTVRRRHRERAWVAAHPGPRVLGGEEAPMPDLRFAPEPLRRTSGALIWLMGMEFGGEEVPQGDAIQGVPGAPGKVKGTVRIVNGPQDFHRVRAGDIMVCPTTTPTWTIVFSTLSGLIAEGGSPLAHAAIAAREHHLPAVLRVPQARERLEDGATVEIDGTAGTVRIIE